MVKFISDSAISSEEHYVEYYGAPGISTVWGCGGRWSNVGVLPTRRRRRRSRRPMNRRRGLKISSRVRRPGRTVRHRRQLGRTLQTLARHSCRRVGRLLAYEVEQRGFRGISRVMDGPPTRHLPGHHAAAAKAGRGESVTTAFLVRSVIAGLCRSSWLPR